MTDPAASGRRAAPVSALGNRCVLVLGMHRSGTSAVTGTLERLGCELGSERIPPAPDNVRGFHENRRIVGLHEQWLSAADRHWYDPHPWPEPPPPTAARLRASLRTLLEQEFGGVELWACKDPRLCRLLPLWLPLLRELEVRAHALLVLRDPEAVAASLERRNALPRSLGYALWCSYVLDSVRDSASLPRATIRYETFLEDPVHTLQTAFEAAGLPALRERSRQRAAEIEAGIDPALRHHRPSGPRATDADDDPWRALARSIHDALLAAPASSAERTLAEARAELEHRQRLAEPYLAALEHTLAAERAAHERYRNRWRRRGRRVCRAVRRLPGVLFALGRPSRPGSSS